MLAVGGHRGSHVFPKVIVMCRNNNLMVMMFWPWTHHVLVKVLKNALFAVKEATHEEEDDKDTHPFHFKSENIEGG